MRGERRDPLPHDQRRARRPSGAVKLRRSGSDRVVAGIAGGIAAFTDADPRWVRAAFVLSLPVSLGVTGVGYLMLWWIVPPEKDA
jgi:phage shock protein PspC (stress-responsive transcriptional regulator)